MTDYKATPEQWAAIEKAQAPVEVAPGTFVAGKDHVLSVILLELRARVEALESNSKPTSNLSQIRSWLVERVSAAIVRMDKGHDWTHAETIATDEARAAIREVAAWLREQGTPAIGWATRLQQEAER